MKYLAIFALGSALSGSGFCCEIEMPKMISFKSKDCIVKLVEACEPHNCSQRFSSQQYSEDEKLIELCFDSMCNIIIEKEDELQSQESYKNPFDLEDDGRTLRIRWLSMK